MRTRDCLRYFSRFDTVASVIFCHSVCCRNGSSRRIMNKIRLLFSRHIGVVAPASWANCRWTVSATTGSHASVPQKPAPVEAWCLFSYWSGSTQVKLRWWEWNHHWTFWANFGMLRDWRRRNRAKDEAPTRLRLKALCYSHILPTAFRVSLSIVWESSAKHSKFLKNMCQYTGRRRGKVTRYRMSRLVFREKADHGKVSGVIRAKWG
ncbi:unnamed protein product [Soboliphyme baturini]|uniref:Ribosomal protein S14 n=1 Tax=Soboliphyme baturini TaxID=241478 RepID=A0A183IQV2_9BILA|nr:unnamed protein product [Soboliphyme baturini]